jgi:hypothetical protein
MYTVSGFQERAGLEDALTGGGKVVPNPIEKCIFLHMKAKGFK